MQQLVVWFNSFLNGRSGDERGATAPEYGLLIALIAVIVATTGQALGNAIVSVLNYVAGWIVVP